MTNSSLLRGLAPIDHAIILFYLVGMLAFGAYLSRRQRTDDEYFLAGRRMPWFAVGMSIIASLLSSLTYLSEPGEVWNSGVTHVIGKLIAIPFEMAIVWIFCVPFMMRFQYTTAYEYLGERFGEAARRIGAGLFIMMVVLWMGFVVLASARALASVSGMPLFVVIGTVGFVATAYTVLGGLRAVIWTDVVQVVLLIGGGAFAIGYVAIATGTWIPDWYAAAQAHLASQPETHDIPWFSFDPRVRATVVTVAINMTVWHVCTHVANQMTVQRYFSTRDASAARRSFVTGSLFSVGLNLMLVVVGLAMLYYYSHAGAALDDGLDSSLKQHRDLIFPTFAVRRLPPGCGGAILAALLAAAMSSIDSGVNSIATVVTVERMKSTGEKSGDHVRLARWITLAAGLFITFAAYGLSFMPGNWGIVDAMPRTFNAITAPLGSMFLIGMFLPRASQRTVIASTLIGLAASISIGYAEQIGGLFGVAIPGLSFTLVMPLSLTVSFLSALLISLLTDRAADQKRFSLTWWGGKDS